MLASHGTAGNGSTALQYDVHSLYGHTMAAATYRASRGILNERPFVLSRCRPGVACWRCRAPRALWAAACQPARRALLCTP